MSGSAKHGTRPRHHQAEHDEEDGRGVDRELFRRWPAPAGPWNWLETSARIAVRAARLDGRSGLQPRRNRRRGRPGSSHRSDRLHWPGSPTVDVEPAGQSILDERRPLSSAPRRSSAKPVALDSLDDKGILRNGYARSGAPRSAPAEANALAAVCLRPPHSIWGALRRRLRPSLGAFRTLTRLPAGGEAADLRCPLRSITARTRRKAIPPRASSVTPIAMRTPNRQSRIGCSAPTTWC